MMQLITISDIQPYKAISINLDTDDKLDPFILEAQQFDLKKLMGDAFYLDFINDFSASPALAKYADLFNGSEFIYAGINYKHEGIKPVLCYLAYARYVLNSNVNATAYGTVRKKTEESEQVDDKTVQRLSNQAYAGALAYWEDVKRFIYVKQYPLWYYGYGEKKTRTNRVGGVENTGHNHDLHHDYKFRHRP